MRCFIVFVTAVCILQKTLVKHEAIGANTKSKERREVKKEHTSTPRELKFTLPREITV